MPYCENCGKEVPNEAKYCPSCGKAVRVTDQFLTTAAGSPDLGIVSPAAAALLDARDIVMKKKIMSMREHYDFEDPSGRKLGEGDGNFFQVPAKFVVLSVTAGSGNNSLEQVM